MSRSRIASHTVMSLWAKHGKKTGYHPLLYHLLDVAAVALALWDTVLTPPTQRRVSDDLGLFEDEARRWLAFLAGSHDLGKASVAFQRQVDAARAILDTAGLTGVAPPSDAPHGSVTSVVLPTLLRDLNVSGSIASRLAAIAGAHHGRFQDPGSLTRIPLGAIGAGPWDDVRRELLEIVARTVDLPSSTPAEITTSTALWLAGFISVADWIGSDERFFVWESTAGNVPQFDENYWDRATDRAARALVALGWRAQPLPTEDPSFRDLMGYQANSMQSAVIELHPAEQGLVIIEAPMGFGKTEAALWLADEWARRLGTRGFYVALPTQATSNQMFTRVASYLRRRYPGRDVNVQLLHGHASLSAEFEELKRGPLYSPSGVADGDGDVLAAEWFTYRKRGLLAPYGVGTIDQVLLAVLQTRHVFVRLFGLSGKTVILDEIHAYDTYMSTLLERLLSWLGALGSPVVLLSATLPEGRRQALARAYASGMGRAFDRLEHVPYPRLTWVAAEKELRSIPLPPPPERSIALRWVDGTLTRGVPLGRRLADALVDGGVAAVVCNSVDRAQRIYSALREHFAPGEVDLFHARYPFTERAQREKRAIAQFGKGGDRPRRVVLVATQVVEQSLDLDFDLLVSDLAPVDLLLQRMGRLHRHVRPERPIRGAEIWICLPERMSEDIPQFDHVTEAIYDPLILLRTWVVLQGRSTITIPADMQALIEAVYAEEAFPSVSPGVAARLAELLDAHNKATEQDQRQARIREIRDPGYRGHLAKIAADPRAEESPELHPAFQALTRLSDVSVPVVLLEETPNGPALPDGTVIDLGVVPSEELVPRLLERSVSLASRRVVYALLEQPVPAGWERRPLLRNHRVVVLPRAGPAQIGRASVSLDRDLGVVIS